MHPKISPAIYFLLLLKASLLSSGGTGNLPSIRADFSARGWASGVNLLHALTIGQISPGPTGLWVVSFGYLTYGIPGSLLAVAAIIGPPMLVLPVRRAYAHLEGFAVVEGFVRGLGIAAIGAFSAILAQFLQHAGIDGFTVCVAAAAFALAAVRRIPSLAILTLAAVAGIVVR